MHSFEKPGLQPGFFLIKTANDDEKDYFFGFYDIVWDYSDNGSD